MSSIQTSDYRVRATTNDIQRLDKFAQKCGWWEVFGAGQRFWLLLTANTLTFNAGKGVRVTEADTLGRVFTEWQSPC